MKGPLDGLTAGLKTVMDEMKQGNSQMPPWSRYVAVTPGAKIKDIVITGLKMHAAVTGTTLHHHCLRFKTPAKKELVDDLKSKINLCYSDCDGYNLLFASNDSFAELRSYYSSDKADGAFVVYLYTLDDKLKSWIEGNAKLHIDAFNEKERGG